MVGSRVVGVEERLASMTKALETVQGILRQAQEHARKFADPKRRGDWLPKVGELVWLSTLNLNIRVPSKKLGPRYIGPFPVVRIINPVAAELKLPSSLRVHPVFHISCLKPHIPCSDPVQRQDPPTPVIIDGQEEYEVEAILDVRRQGRGLKYLVSWRGFGAEENSWEPGSNLHAPDLVTAFHRAHPDKPSPRGIQRLPLRGGQCYTFRPAGPGMTMPCSRRSSPAGPRAGVSPPASASSRPPDVRRLPCERSQLACARPLQHFLDRQSPGAGGGASASSSVLLLRNNPTTPSGGVA